MNEFFVNVTRYNKFFISSFFGLILILLKPIFNIVKSSKITIFFIIGICFLFTLVIKSMLVI